MKVFVSSIWLGHPVDHISEVFHQLSSRYQNPHWLICGDSNDLKLDAIIALSSGLKQVVTEPTRISSQKILDPVITDLHSYYQTPKIEAPLDSDDDNGSPSDHMMVLLRPLDTINKDVSSLAGCDPATSSKSRYNVRLKKLSEYT